MFSLPALAGGIAVYPTTASVRVGEQITLHAEDQPGGLSSGFPYSVTFGSDDPSIAEISGFASGKGYLQPYPYPNNGTVYVTGIAPGVAHVIVPGSTAKFATITVTGDIGVTITPVGMTVRNGDTVTLVALVNGGYTNVTLEWFLGRTGDTSHLINVGPLLRFQPQAAKTYVWVQATGAAAATTAEVEIDVLQRWRAVRH
jgi:hypothetical protein